MKELNPLVLALNEIDTHYIVEPKRRKRHIALMIAAAAAAMTLLTGFTVRIMTSDNAGVNINYENQFRYNITDNTDLNILTKSELLQLGAIERGDYDKGIYTFLFQNALPSNILKLYNAAPITLGNDNFTEEPCDIFVHAGVSDTETFRYVDITFSYQLTHKNTGIKLNFDCVCSINGYEPIVSHSHTSENKYITKIIDLNDGSKCLLDEGRNEERNDVWSYADFSYNGTVYWIDSNFNHMDIDQMEQVLSDLGVL